MAITQNSLAGGGSTTDGTSVATASFTPTANRLVLAAILTTHGSATPNEPTASGNGLTWVSVASVPFNTVGTPRSRLTVFRAMGAAPTAGALTFDFAGQTQQVFGWSVTEFDGVDTSGTNGSGAIVQAATNAQNTVATTFTVTLGAFADANNGTYGAFGIDAQTAITVGSGFTQIHSQAQATPDQRIYTEWRADNDTSVDATSVSRDWGGIGIELAVAPAGTTTQHGTDTLPLGLGEGATVAVRLWTTDTLPVRLTEVGTQSVPASSVTIHATDSVAVGLVDLATPMVMHRTTDTLGVRLTEAGKVILIQRATDTLGVRVSDASSVVATTPVAGVALRAEAAFLIDLVGASGTWRLATRPMELPLPGYQGRLRAAPTVSARLQDAFWGPIEYQELAFEIDNADGALTADYLAGLSGNAVTAARFDPVSNERIDWWVGVVSVPALGRGVVKITATNLNLAALDPVIPRGTITAAQFPKADNCYGETIPVSIGTPTNCPLYLVNRDDTNSIYDYLVGRGTPTATLKVRGPNGQAYAIPTSRTIMPTTVKSQAFNASSQSVSVTTTGTDRCLLVGVALSPGGGGNSVSAMTYNGVALTKIGATSNGTTARAEWWFLIAPATGTHTLAVTLTGARPCTVTAYGLTGVDQTMVAADCGYTNAMGTSATPSVTVTGGATGQQAFDMVAVNSPAIEAAGTGQIQLAGQSAAVTQDGFGSIEAGAASVTMSWQLDGSRIWSASAVRVRPAANYTLNTTAYSGLTVARFLYPQVDGGGNPIQYVADITGLSTERNPGRAVRTALTNTDWGLGYTTATNPYTGLGFNAAAATIPSGIVLDVWMGTPKPAKEWIGEWCMTRGLRLGVAATGGWYLWVDASQRTVQLAVGDPVGDGPKNLTFIKERQPTPLPNRISGVRLNYRPDLLNGGTFQFSYLRSVFASGQERAFDFPSVRDHTAGDMIACYLAKRFRYNDEHVALGINGLLGRALLEGDLITLDVPSMGYLGERVLNAGMETWDAGASAAPTGWTLVGTGATVARDGTNKDQGSYAAAVTRVGTDCFLIQDLALLDPRYPLSWWRGRTITFSMRVRATVASAAAVVINDGVAPASTLHNGDGTFQTLSVTVTVSLAATQVTVACGVVTTNTTAQFDGGVLSGTVLELAGIEKDLHEVRATARGWEPDIYVYTAGTLNTDPTPDPPTPPIDLTPPTIGNVPTGPTGLVVGVWGKQALIQVQGTPPKPWDFTRLYVNTVQDFATATLKAEDKRTLFHLDDLAYGSSPFFFATYVSAGVESLPQPTVPAGGGSPTQVTAGQWGGGDIGTGAVGTGNIATTAVSQAAVISGTHTYGGGGEETAGTLTLTGVPAGAQIFMWGSVKMNIGGAKTVGQFHKSTLGGTALGQAFAASSTNVPGSGFALDTTPAVGTQSYVLGLTQQTIGETADYYAVAMVLNR